jgi:hypothetical protein
MSEETSRCHNGQRERAGTAKYPVYGESVGMLTTYELRDRKRELDLAIRDGELDASTRAALKEQFGAVLAEQAERAQSRWAQA